MEEIKLTDASWDDLFPDAFFTIGKQQISVHPFGITALADVMTRLEGTFARLQEKGVTVKNYKDKDKIILVAKELLADAPDVIRSGTNLNKDDFGRLPLHVATALALKVVEVNMASKEAFTKNLKALGDLFTPETNKKDRQNRR